MTRFTASLLALAMLSACGSRGSWKPGEVYSIKASEAGGFMVSKVLSVDDQFVWLSVYTEKKFTQRPGASDLDGLSKWTIIWSTHGRMKQDDPLWITSIEPSAEEVTALGKAKTMLHHK